MNCYGLFVGIDKYRSKLISDLTCSARDAEALHGLFSDTFGGDNSVLLTNERATREAILGEFENRLWKTETDDVVVLLFSGHGSSSHHLITSDADPLALDATAIHLDDLTEQFSKIPARNVILFLDCCFAGGAGAKVFNPEYAKKVPMSADEILGHISGRGRVILAAAKSDQEAIEDRRRGHGLFSFYLIEGLLGAPEISKGGRISFLALVDFMTRRVADWAAQIRHNQEPIFRGSIEGEFTLPILRRGIVFLTYFPERAENKIGANVGQLSAFGFPQQLIDVWRGTISELNELQQLAINDHRVLEGNHLVVSAPTSTGKTMVGELAAIRAYMNHERTYFLLPLRALVNDKFDEFVRKYGPFGLRIVRATGEIADDVDALVRGKFDIALLTYEKFAALALINPHMLRQVGLVVVDEVQMIADRNRGVNLEFILTLLRSQRRLGIEPQIIALSAVIGDTNGLEDWLSAGLLRYLKRPVPLLEGTLNIDGTFHYLSETGEEKWEKGLVSAEYRKGSSQDIIIPLVKKLMEDGEKVIVFRETRPIVRATANYLSNSLGLPPAQSEMEQLPTGDPSVASGLLRECLVGGVAFHSTDLDRQERRILEESFRDPKSSLRVLVATTTLAMGVNTPAWSVVIAGLEHPDGPYSVAEYKNMVGRAGRLGYSPLGKSFLISPSHSDEYRDWSRYVTSKPEDIVSRFTDSEPLSLICRILATAALSRINSMSEQEIIDFVEDSLAAFQARKRSGQVVWTAQRIRESLQALLGRGLVDAREGKYRLTELGRIAGESGVAVVSVVALVDALRGVPIDQLTGHAFLAAALVTQELDEIFIPVHKRSVQERARWQGAIAQQRLPVAVFRAVRLTAGDDANYTARCKKIAALLMWVEGTDLNLIEQSILRHLPGDNAAGQIRAVADRTRDILPAVGRVAEVLLGINLELVAVDRLS
jgi:helicase